MKEIPRRLFTAHEPTLQDLRLPEPQTVAGEVAVSATPVIRGAEANEADRKGVAGLPAAMAPFRDVPRGVWTLYLSAWATLFGLFALFFAVDLASAFVVTISCLFAVMAFGLPIVLSALPQEDRFARGAVVETYTGPLSVTAAGAQIVLIPGAAVFGLIAFILLAK
jgi:hypothetical protein